MSQQRILNASNILLPSTGLRGGRDDSRPTVKDSRNNQQQTKQNDGDDDNIPNPETNPYEFGIAQFYDLRNKVLNYVEHHNASLENEAKLRAELVERDNEIILLKNKVAQLTDTIEILRYAEGSTVKSIITTHPYSTLLQSTGILEQINANNNNNTKKDDNKMHDNITTMTEVPHNKDIIKHQTDSATTDALRQHVSRLQSQVSTLTADNIKLRQDNINIKVECDKYQHELVLATSKLQQSNKKCETLLAASQTMDGDVYSSLQAKFNEFSLVTKQYDTYFLNLNPDGSKETNTQTSINNSIKSQSQYNCNLPYNAIKNRNDLFDNIDSLKCTIEQKSNQIKQYLYVIYQFKQLTTRLRGEIAQSEVQYKKLDYNHQLMTQKFDKMVNMFKQTIALHNQVEQHDAQYRVIAASDKAIANNNKQQQQNPQTTKQPPPDNQSQQQPQPTNPK